MTAKLPYYTTGIHEMRVTEQAAEALTAMHEQAAGVAAAWGRSHPDTAIKCLTSLSRNTAQLFNTFFGNTSTISRDGELSLFVSTASGYVYGLIFHGDWVDPAQPEDPANGRATRMGRYCFAVVDDSDGRRCGHPFVNGEATCEGHNPVCIAAPVPGTWSFHS